MIQNLKLTNWARQRQHKFNRQWKLKLQLFGALKVFSVGVLKEKERSFCWKRNDRFSTRSSCVNMKQEIVWIKKIASILVSFSKRKIEMEAKYFIFAFVYSTEHKFEIKWKKNYSFFEATKFVLPLNFHCIFSTDLPY